MAALPGVLPATTCELRDPCAWVLRNTHNKALANLVDWFVHAPLRILLVALAAIIITKVVGRLIGRTMGTVVKVQGHASGDERTRLRTQTLNTVLRSASVGLIWTVAVITVLPELGVNLGAFVATATVIGGAIVFGAQQVVRDFLAGLFVVAEDQYGVGDLVDLGFVEGWVERVSLRSARVRDAHGKVWHIPHGNVERVANLSQGWSQAVLDVPVAREADPTTAIATLTEVAHELLDDPVVGPAILDEPRVLGVQEVLDDRMVLRLVVKTRPAMQYDVLRALRLRVLDASAAGRLPVPEHSQTMVIRRFDS